MSKIGKKIDVFFGVTEKGSLIKTEIYAGIATFLAMAYILTTNPNMMQGFTYGGRTAALIIATAFGAIIGTGLLALYAKMPLAQAPGMGLNSMVGSILAFGLVGVGFSFSYPNMMVIILISGLIFFAVSLIPAGKSKETGASVSVREKIFDGIPPALRSAIPVGIGLFIAFIGLQNAKIITANPGTLVSLVSFNTYPIGAEAKSALVCLFGLVVIAVLSHFKVKGSVLIGIIAATLLAMPLGITNFKTIAGNDGIVSWNFVENFGKFFSFDADEGAFGLLFKDGFSFPKGSVFTVIILVITFSMIDMFDTIGTIVGCTAGTNLADKNGKPLRYSRIMYSDSIATVIGSVMGTSTVTTFVESGAGIAAGGRTGLTALTVALLFLLSIFILPIFAFIPPAAAASALIYVGVLMIGQVKSIDFKNIKYAVPAFITIIGMPLTYSITNGIGLGILSYVVISLICHVIESIRYKAGKNKDEKGVNVKPSFPISLITAIIALLFLVYFIVPQAI